MACYTSDNVQLSSTASGPNRPVTACAARLVHDHSMAARSADMSVQRERKAGFMVEASLVQGALVKVEVHFGGVVRQLQFHLGFVPCLQSTKMAMKPLFGDPSKSAPVPGSKYLSRRSPTDLGAE